MRKIIIVLVSASILIISVPLFAAESAKADSANSSAAAAPKKSVFNRMSEFFSTFDRPFTRPSNTQGFWNSTASWIKKIDKY